MKDALMQALMGRKGGITIIIPGGEDQMGLMGKEEAPQPEMKMESKEEEQNETDLAPEALKEEENSEMGEADLVGDMSDYDKEDLMKREPRSMMERAKLDMLKKGKKE